MSDPQKRQVSPVAVVMEASALNDFYKTRVLILADEIERLRKAGEDQQKEIERLTKTNETLQAKTADKKPKVMKNGLSS